MRETGNSRIEKALFYLMLVFSCLAYAGYYIYARRNGVILRVSYSRSSEIMMKQKGLIVYFFRFGKDACAALLLLVEMFSMNRTARAKIFVGIMAIVSYGTIVALLNDMSIMTIVSGYRMVMYFGALAMFFNSRHMLRLFVKPFFGVVSVLLSANVVIALIQAYDCLGMRFLMIGQGSFRFMGLFPSAAAFAYFCFGSTLFAYCVSTKLEEFKRLYIYIFVMSFIGCFISGTRSSMMNLLVVVFLYMINQTRMKQMQKVFVTILLSMPIVVYVVQFSTNLANRGSILGNALEGGRFTIFVNAILNQPVISILFGNGIGAGSNSAAEFLSRMEGEEVLFLDGTFTTLFYQFGVVGVVFVLILLGSITKQVYQKRGILNTFLFTGSVVLQCLTTNILEAFALLIMLFICYYTLIEGEDVFCELNEGGDRVENRNDNLSLGN